MLALKRFPVEEITWAERNRWDAGKLEISAQWIQDLAREDPRIQDLRCDLACPGEKKRIIKVLDVVEPREKIEGRGGVFPGVLSPLLTAGQGLTHRLEGVAVMTCGKMMPEDTLRDQQEAFIDMCGEGVKYSPFSRTLNLVLTCSAASGVNNREFEDATRRLLLKVARGLAALTRDFEGEVTLFDFSGGGPGLPRLVHICELTTFGRGFDTLVYGRSFEDSFPTPLESGEFLDGAVVNADFHYAGQRTPTYFFQNNPVLSLMQTLHGKELAFRGTILTHVHNTHEDKKRAAEFTGKLARLLGADMALVSATSGGNAHVDAMFSVQACEEQGIRTALIQVETAGEEGADSPFVDYVSEADLIISTGNREQRVEVDPSLEPIGGESAHESQEDRQSPCRIPVRSFYASTNQLGAWNLQGKLF